MMNRALGLLLIFGLVTGQLVKIPSGNQSGATLLDLAVIILDLILLFILKFKIPKPSAIFIWATAFLFIASASLLLTPLRLTFFEQLSSAFYLGRFAIYLALGWLLLSSKLNKIRENVPLIFIVAGTVMATLGLFQLVLLPDLGYLAQNGWDPHYFRTVSTLLDPNFMGTFFVLILLLLFIQGFSLIGKRWTIISFIIIYIALITTFSRGAALMLVITFLAIAAIKKSPQTALIALILTAGFGISFLRYTKTVAEPRNIDRQQSAEFRVDSWQEGLVMFQKSPILGVGFNAYRFALRDYNLAPDYAIQSRGGSANDSSLLFVASTTGIIGLISYLAFLIVVLKTSLSAHLKGNSMGTILFASFTGLIIESFFANSLFYPWMLTWIFLTISQLQSKPR